MKISFCSKVEVPRIAGATQRLVVGTHNALVGDGRFTPNWDFPIVYCGGVVTEIAPWVPAEAKATAQLAGQQVRDRKLIIDSGAFLRAASMNPNIMADVNKALAKHAKRRYQSGHPLSKASANYPHCSNAANKPASTADCAQENVWTV